MMRTVVIPARDEAFGCGGKFDVCGVASAISEAPALQVKGFGTVAVIKMVVIF